MGGSLLTIRSSKNFISNCISIIGLLRLIILNQIKWLRWWIERSYKDWSQDSAKPKHSNLKNSTTYFGLVGWLLRLLSKRPHSTSPLVLMWSFLLRLGFSMIKVENHDKQENLSWLRASLDQLKETKNWAQIQIALYQQQVACYYNAQIQTKIFWSGDLILCRTEVSKPIELGKLAPNWEGPYRITEVIKPRAYMKKK